ncbi:MAG: hypothetical protein LBK42_10320 [Propionibacteriaceae bacterium]|jgi:hypothetical protein|nr:hypothetical protein [Propionibacteriaceae bacterium]
MADKPNIAAPQHGPDITAPQTGPETAEQAQTAEPEGFPAGTPLAEMTVEQQAAYWKHHARRHEGAAKAARDEADQLRKAALTDQEKAVEDVKDAARREGEATDRWRRTAVTEAVIGAAKAAGRYTTDEDKAAVGALLSMIDPVALITEEGELDRAKIEQAIGRPSNDPPARGSGYAARTARLQPGGAGAGSVAAAKAAFLETHQKK